jgi:hypothetical protein
LIPIGQDHQEDYYKYVYYGSKHSSDILIVYCERFFLNIKPAICTQKEVNPPTQQVCL